MIRPRHPFGKDKQHFDYSVDSDEDWEEEDFEGSDVEDLNSENESDEELEDEESVAGCGGGEEFEGDGWVVPHGYLSEGEGVQEIDSDDEDHDVDNEDEIQRKGDPLSPDFTIEDDPFEKAKLKKSIKEKSKFVVIGQGISSKATFNPIKTGIALAPKIIGPIFIANDGIRIEKATCQYSVFDVEKLKQYALSFVDDLSESLEKLNILVSHDSTILAPVGVNPFEYVFSVDKDSEELLPMLSLRQKDNDSGNGGKEQKRLIKERERQEKKEAKEQKRTMLEAEKKRKLEENNKRKIEEREYKRKQLELEQDFKRKQQIDIRENLENQFGGSLNTIMPLDTLFGTISETHVPPNMLLKEFTEAMRLPFIKLVHGSVLGQSKLYEEFKRRVAPVTRKLFEDKLMDWTIKEKRAEANTKKFLWIIKADILLDCGLTEDQLLSLIQLNSAIKVVPSVDPHMRGRPFQSLSISLPNRPSQRSTRESSSGLTCESTHANILLPRHYNFLQKSSPYNPFMTGIGLSLTAEAPLLENPSMDEEADTLIEL